MEVVYDPWLPAVQSVNERFSIMAAPSRGARWLDESASTGRDRAQPAVLSAKTFCTLVREFSPLGLREGRVEEDTLAGRR